MRVARRQVIPAVYEAVRIDVGFYADMMVENQVIEEIKAVETVAPVHKKELLTSTLL
jgi:GxxExxY protein